MDQPKSSNVPLIVGVAVAALFGVVFVIGILASLAIYGMRNYLAKAKEAEGRTVVHMIARGAVACSARGSAAGTQSLPVTTTAVPPTLDDVSGRKYMSAPGDWKTPGWDCIGHAMADPQYFQYRWTRTSATQGVASATADLDGDLAPDVTFEVPVTCTMSSGLDCSVGTLREIR